MLEKETLHTKRLLSEQHVQNEADQMELKSLKTSMTTIQAVQDQKMELQLQIQQGQKQIQEITTRDNEAQHWIKELELATTKYQNLEEANVEMMVRSTTFEQWVTEKIKDAGNIQKF